MDPAARNRARIAGWVFRGSFALAVVGVSTLGVVFGLPPFALLAEPTPKRLAALCIAALGIAACATVGFWWATRPRPDRRARATITPAATTPASDGDWPY